MSRKRGGKSGGILPSAAVREALRGDYPPAVKAQLRLSLRGGRQKRQRCLGCGGVGVHCDVYVSYRAMTVAGDSDGRGCVVYWTCHGCHVAGMTPSMEAKLQGGSR